MCRHRNARKPSITDSRHRILPHYYGNTKKTKMKKLTLLALIACSMLLSGCTSVTVPMTTTALDADAKKFQPEPNKASIYINQKHSFRLRGMTVETILDGRIVGFLAADTYQLLSVAPGEHLLITSTQFGNAVQTNINAQVGKNYFYEISLSVHGGQALLKLNTIGDAEGQKAVVASQRADAVVY